MATMTDASGDTRANAIEVDHVTLELGDRAILDDASFTVLKGEFIGVLGPNGAGKTTLMRALLGLLPLSSGSIRVDGEAVVRGNPSIVAMAADGHHWGLPHASPAVRADVERVLDLVDAHALAARPLSELSGGERQRLLLAQCLLGKPKVLLLDEPLISLDPRHQTGVVDLVRRVQRELCITVLFSAHELNPLLNSLDRVLYLGNGRAALGTVDEVITKAVLSRLYGSPIDVMRVNGRIFVMSGGVEIDKLDHAHEEGDEGHEHDHEHDHDHGHGHGHDHKAKGKHTHNV
jgi:zinc/manganese transport system ATP-binding protein